MNGWMDALMTRLKGIWSKEVLKSNFWQYGQMEKQRWEESEKRKSQKKEDAGARKGPRCGHCSNLFNTLHEVIPKLKVNKTNNKSWAARICDIYIYYMYTYIHIEIPSIGWTPYHCWYPTVESPFTLWTNIAIDNGHRNCWFTHQKWWFSIKM